MAERKQQLALAIIDFLEASSADGSVKEDDKESLEVAVNCISEAFGVDPSSEAQRKRLSIKPATLSSILDLYLQTKEKMKNAQSTSTASASTQATPTTPKPSSEDKAAAEKHKMTGNAKMTGKDYAGAISAYNSAIELDPTNPVYYSNRAAAHSSSGDHAAAVVDAEKAIEADPKFIKAYHRLGHAHYSLGAFESAASAFQRGLDLEPTNASLKTGKDNATARIPAPSTSRDASAPTAPAAPGPGGFDDVLRSLGGGAGPGGLDIAGLMSNPAIMNMAQQMMGNGGLENLMSNPAISNMMNRVQSGGAMPSMAELMNDPTMRQMAEQFRNSGAGRGGAPGP